MPSSASCSRSRQAPTTRSSRRSATSIPTSCRRSTPSRSSGRTRRMPTGWSRIRTAAGRPLEFRPHRGCRGAAGSTRARPSADWRIRPVQPPISPAEPAAAEAAFRCDVLVVGGGPPARPSPRSLAERAATSSCSRRRTTRAFTSASRCCRPTSRCSTGSACATQVEAIGMPKYGVEFVSPDHEHRQLHRVRRGLGQVDAVRLAGAPLRARRAAVPQRRRARARAPSKARACARSRSTPTARRSQVELDDGARRSWRARFVVDASGRDTLLANQLRCKEKNTAPQQLGALRPFPRRRAAARQARGQHHDLLVRARLVLVHSARRRHHQRRRGLLAVLPEVARASRCPSSSPTRSRCARRSAERLADATLVDDARLRHRQLLVRERE